VLTECLIRFSQRQVFEDLHELQPEVASFGNEDEIKKFMEIDPVLSRRPHWLREAVARHVLSTPGREAELIEQTKGWLTGPNEVRVLCLTEYLMLDDMWRHYADNRRGFVVAFDTTHPRFNQLRSPGRLGKVEYTDAPISSFLSAYGMNTFFQKRTRYGFEAEWRVIRMSTRFKPENIRQLGTRLPIYLAEFDPACISAIVIREECTVEWNLRTLAAVDARYRHVSVDLLKL
jgi:hypothetical protein